MEPHISRITLAKGLFPSCSRAYLSLNLKLRLCLTTLQPHANTEVCSTKLMEAEKLWVPAARAPTPLHRCAKEMRAAGAWWSPPSDPGTAGCRPRPLSWMLGTVIKYLLMMLGANCSSKLESWYFQALVGVNLSEINVLALTKYFYD